MRQPDLFAPPPAPLPPGLSYRGAILTPQEEASLIRAIDAVALAPFRFQGWLGKRLTASFGWHYDFEHAALGPTAPIPDWLRPIRDRAAACVGLVPADLVQALLTRYDPGAGIGWHRDRPVFGHVVGLSLGIPATLRLRRRQPDGFARATLPLAPRSLYHLTGEARRLWEHSIAALPATRWSITFRTLATGIDA